MRPNLFSTVNSLILFFLFSLSGSGQEIELYISPNGNDNNPGTREAPFKSLEKARDSVRIIRSGNPNDAVVVYVNGGTYFMDKPVIFSSIDSGNEDAPVIYKTLCGEEPVFTGSKRLENWQKSEDSEKLRLLPSTVRGKVYVANLKEAGIQDFGDPTELGKRPELFCNKQLQTLARWPNVGFTYAGHVRGATELPPDFLNSRRTKEGIFEYLNERQNRWVYEKDARIGGYWGWDWRDGYHQIEKIDTVTKTIYVKRPYHNDGYRTNFRYFGLNLFCELDSPGEWYLDRSDGLLYWYPPEGVDPEEAEVTLSLGSVYNTPYMIEMNNCSYLTLQGLTFQEGRESGIFINEGKNCTIADCRIERFGRNGIRIGGGTGHRISGCLLRTLGCSGIWVKGGNRRNLHPANHVVEHTVIEHFSLFKRTYEPGLRIEGCGIRISNNRLKHSSSSAMRLNGNDFIVEYNEISHVVTESDDQGGIDMWRNPSYRGIIIRYNHWSDISGGTHNGAAAIRFDDMISGAKVYGNIFERCGSVIFGAVQINKGKDNVVENNLFYKCRAAVSFHTLDLQSWLEKLDSPEIQKLIYEDVNILSPLYQEKYPELKNIRSNPSVNTIKNNLLAGCSYDFFRDNDLQIMENNSSISEGGKKIDELYTPDVLNNYGLEPIPFQEMGPKMNKWIGQDITVYLDAGGNASVTADTVGHEYYTECEIDSFSLSKTNFSCEDLGPNLLALSAIDSNGNINNATATITVKDTIKPIAFTKDTIIYVDANGNASISAEDVDNGSFDNCGKESFSLSKLITCNDVGVNSVTLTVTDASGNYATSQFKITVRDTIAPVAICEEREFYLDKYGRAIFYPSDLEGESYDNCGIGRMWVSPDRFSCSKTGENIVTLTVEDHSGNRSTCNSIFTVLDTLPPIIETIDSVKIELGSNDFETKIDYPEIKVTDNCSFVLEQIEGLGPDGIFPVGTTTETWIATDENGNTTTASFKVFVEDYTVGSSNMAMNKFEIQLYPNPTSAIVTVHITPTSDQWAEVTVTNILGEKVLHKRSSANKKIILDMSGSASGMYFLKINFDGKSLLKKLILNRF